MKLKTQLRVENADKLREVATHILSHVERPAIVFFKGAMGVGKTTLIAEFCRSFDLKTVQSPTYAIHQHYQNDHVKIDHFDLYRLETEDQIEASGFHDQLAAASDYKFIEWSEKLHLENYSYLTQAYLLEIKKASDSEARVYLLYSLF